MATSNTGFAQSIAQFVRTVVAKLWALLARPKSAATARPAENAPENSTPSPITPVPASLTTAEEALLARLYPPFAKSVREFVLAARAKGYAVGVESGLRTMAEQTQLYAEGRTAPGKIVTNARAGYSFHNYGVAADVVFDANPPHLKWSWDESHPWMELARLGQSMGLEPGALWPHPDDPHYETTYGQHEAVLYAIYIAKGMPAVWEAFDHAAQTFLPNGQKRLT